MSAHVTMFMSFLMCTVTTLSKVTDFEAGGGGNKPTTKIGASKRGFS